MKLLLFAIYFQRLVYANCSMFGGLQLCFSKERWLCVRTDGFYLQRTENSCGPCENLYYNGNDSWKCTLTKSYEIFEDCRSSWAELEKYFDEEEFANLQKQNEEKEIEAKQEMDEELKKIDSVTGQKIKMVANKLQFYKKGELLMLLKEPGVSPDLTIQKLAANPEKIQAQEKDDEDDYPEPYQAYAVDKEELLMLLKEPGVSPDLTIQKLAANPEKIQAQEKDDEDDYPEPYQAYAVDKEELLMLLKEPGVSPDLTIQKLVANPEKIQAYLRQDDPELYKAHREEMLLKLLEWLEMSIPGLTIHKLVAILEHIEAYERQVDTVARDKAYKGYYDELVIKRNDWNTEHVVNVNRQAVQGEIHEIETVKDEDEAAKGMELKAREEL